MISRIQNKFGTAGLVVAIVALIAALTGVAYAAQGLNGKQKKEVKKIAKKFAGKPGPVGPPGPQGPAGPAGKAGANGTNGADGKSVTSSQIASGGACGAQTGVKYTLGTSSTNVCNGETGFTDTLPAGKTETGVWALGPTSATSVVPLSFNIPLAEAPVGIHFVNSDGEEETGESAPVENPVNCLGTATEPEANPGHLCIYEIANLGGAGGWFYTEGLVNAYETGATFMYLIEANQVAFGSWAVTAATS